MYSVCNGRGICVSDPNYGKSKCLCDTHWKGDLCTDYYLETFDVFSSSKSAATISTILWICIVLLVLLVLFSVFLCHRIRLQEQYIIGKNNGGYVQSMLDDDGNDNFNSVTNVLNVADNTQTMGIVGNIDNNNQNENDQLAISNEDDKQTGVVGGNVPADETNE